MSTQSSNTELNITRIIDAPRDLVFRAWTEPEQVKQWWGPKDFTNPVCEIDLKPGGSLHIDMKGPDGNIYPVTGIFREVSAPGKLVFTASALNEQGDIILENLNTVILEEHDGKTILKLEVQVLRQAEEAGPYLEGMEEGWNQTLDKMQAFAQN